MTAPADVSVQCVNAAACPEAGHHPLADHLPPGAAELYDALEAWRQAMPRPSGGPSAAEYRAGKVLAYRAACLLRALGVEA